MNEGKSKYSDYPVGVQRESILKAHAAETEEKVIFRPLGEQQLAVLEKEMIEKSITIRQHDEILDKAKAQHKSDTVSLKQEHEYMFNKIRAKGEEVYTLVHKFFNHDEMTVEYYDNEGVFVESRNMMPSEKNAIFGNLKTEPIIKNLAANG